MRDSISSAPGTQAQGEQREQPQHTEDAGAGTSGARSTVQGKGGARRLHGVALVSVLAALMLTLLLEALDQTVVGTALPRIIGELNGFDRYTWVVTAYLLGSVTVTPIVGKLSDQFGRKWFFVVGVILFLLGSGLSGAAQTIDQLIAFRALQGIGAGTGIALVFTVVGDIFTPAERARWQGIFASVYGFSSVVGPLVGGWLTDHGPLVSGFITDASRWRWVFYVNLPLGLIALIALLVYLPANISVRTSQLRGWAAIRRIDFLGAALACGGTICLLLGLTWGGQTYPWGSWQVIGALVAAGVLFAGFVLAERFAAEPILPLSLFRNQVFASAAMLSLTIGAILLALAIYLPLYLQGVLGAQATYSGTLVTPLTISLVVGASLGGVAVSRTGRYQWVTIVGAVLLCIGVFLLTQVDRADPNVLFVMGRDMVITGVGLGVFLSILTLAVQNALPRTRLGVGTSSVRYMQATGQTLGVALVGTVVNNTVTAQLNASLPKIQNIGYLNSAARSVATNQQILTNQQYHDGVYAQVTHQAVAHGVPAIVKATAPGIIKQQVAAQSAHIPPGPGHAQAVAQLTQQITAKVTAQVTAQATHEITRTTETLLNNVVHALKDALAVGVIQGFWVTLFLAGVTLALTLLLKDVPLARTFREGGD